MEQDYDPSIRNEYIESKLKEIGKIVGSTIPPGYGFTLMIFGFNDNHELFYISNANRDDMIKALAEFSKGLKGRK